MPVLHAIILGIVQGLTEALPISSSAHLVIVPWLFKWHYQGLSFDVALHLGTAAAFIVYFFKDWMEMLRSAFTKNKMSKNNIFWFIVIATIPGAAAGLILEKKAETIFRSPLSIAAMLFLFAVILWLADHIGKKGRSMEEMDLKTAFVIGLAQAIAIMPGVSRSGITMTAGLFQGFSREAAAKFSFLLATPIIIAAGVLKLSKLHASDLNNVFWLGLASSAVSGFIGIRFLLGFVKKSNLNIFVLYRIVLAVAILAVFFVR
jgi:undecaprenyl-diphosphatase